MTTEAFSQRSPAPSPKASLIKLAGRAAYRLLEQMTERAYRQHEAYLRAHYGL